MRYIASASTGCFALYASNNAIHSPRRFDPRAPIPRAKCSRTPSGTRNFASSGQP